MVATRIIALASATAAPLLFTLMPQVHGAAGDATRVLGRSVGDGLTTGAWNIELDNPTGDVIHLTTGPNTAAPRIVADAATTVGSPLVDSATAAFTVGAANVGTDLGMTLVGAGIPAGASVGSIVSATRISMVDASGNALNATATATNVSLTIGSGPSVNGAIIAMGVDNGGQGLVVRNKYQGIGINLQQLDTVALATAYAFVLDHFSHIAPAVLWRFQGATATQPMFMLAGISATLGQKLLSVSGSNQPGGSPTSGYIDAYSGEIIWARSISTIAPNSSVTPQFLVSDEAGSNSTDTYLQSKTTTDHGLVLTRYSGSAGLFYSSKLVSATDRIKLLVGNGAQAKGTHTYTTGIEIRGTSGGITQMGFFGHAVVSQQTKAATMSTGGAETNVNLATAINAINTALVNLGLAA